MGIEYVLISICSLLDDPLDAVAANVYKTNIEEYNNKVMEYVRKYAM